MTERCICGRLGYLGSEIPDLALYACGDGELYCRRWVVALIDRALSSCVHGRLIGDDCFPCEVMRAGTTP